MGKKTKQVTERFPKHLTFIVVYYLNRSSKIFRKNVSIALISPYQNILALFETLWFLLIKI